MATAALGALFLVLPFEPSRPTLPFLLGRLTLLEAAAAVVIAILLWTGRRRLIEMLRNRPWPLLFLWAFAAAHLTSAALAPEHRALAGRFAVRMVAAALFATAVAVAPPRAHGRALGMLVASTTVVAMLAIVEAAGLTWLDPFLDLFRESWVVVGAVRRATAGSEHPNLAGALLACGLVSLAALAAGPTPAAAQGASDRRAADRVRAALLLPAALLGLGLLSTYSRGALLAAAVGLAVLAGALLKTARRAAVPPAAALLVLAISAAALGPEGSILRLRLTTGGTGAWYQARYEPAATTYSLSPGESRRAQVRVTNTGRQTWTREAGFCLAYHLHDGAGDRVGEGYGPSMPHDIRPGESSDLEVPVRAPLQEGRYVLAWDMVQPNADWFSKWGVPPALVTLTVDRAGAAAPGVPPRPELLPSSAHTGQPTRRELWRAALAMWRDRPVAGVGPDNFRRLLGVYTGRTAWDTRTFSNNTYLEAAATVGILGLSSLLGVFASALVSCARALVRPTATRHLAAGGMALTAALAAHGMVDYVLAFTGHYLFFAFVVGMAAALDTAA